MSALLNEQEQLEIFTSTTEAAHYHDPNRPGFFSLLSGMGSEKRQRSYKLQDMPQVLSLLDKKRDSWISQAEFTKPNRRVVNLWRVGLLFTDIDTYSIDWLANTTLEKRVQTVLYICEQEGIPCPSLIIFSGRGLQAKWLLTTPLPRAALPRWNAAQRALVDRLEVIGADAAAKDASRVLRLVQTTSSKSGEVCRVVHVTEENGEPIRYDFDYLCEHLLSYTREALQQLRQERAEAREQRKALRLVQGGRTSDTGGLHRFSTRTLAWHRLEDLRKLMEMRGGVAEGQRMLHLFWQLNFLLLSGATNSMQMYHEAKALAHAIDPSWHQDQSALSTLYTKAKDHEAGKLVTFQGREYPALYTPKNATLIDAFGITDEEQRELRTIITPSLARERDADRKKAQRRAAGAGTAADYNAARAHEMAQRKQQAVLLREKGMSYRAIAHELSVSVATVHNYLK